MTNPDYELLRQQARALLEGEDDPVTNAANLSALIYHGIDRLNWVGFYFMRDGELRLGPFQGQPACTRIAVGSGVCGTAVASRATQRVDDVERFPGHIACDAASRSELVVPLLAGSEVLGVLDIDSPEHERFSSADQAGLEALAAVWLNATRVDSVPGQPRAG